MKVIAISDLHGYLPTIEPFDLLLICGDVCPVQNHIRTYQEEWLSNEFAEWINGLPFNDTFSKVVMCAGNHDIIFDGLGKHKKKDWLSHIKDDRLVYLDNEEYEFLSNDGKTYKIFGCPYCKVFGNWAFMRENLEKYYDFIPEKLDFLITHDSADIDNLGMISLGRWKGENAGNVILANYVNKVKPKYYFSGHIHSGRHELKEIDGIKSANVSIMDEYYYPSYLPLTLNIE